MEKCSYDGSLQLKLPIRSTLLAVSSLMRRQKIRNLSKIGIIGIIYYVSVNSKPLHGIPPILGIC